LVVWKLDRLSRSLKDVLGLIEKIAEAGAGFRSLTEAIDTTTPAGRMMMQIVGTFAEFERAMLRERTQSDLDMARTRSYRWSSAQAQGESATGDREPGEFRKEVRSRRRPPV